jgi:hypothetical protein
MQIFSLPIEHFIIFRNQMSSSFPKIVLGTKYVTVNDPIWLHTLFANHLFSPVITPMKVERGGVVMYNLQVRDLNTDKVLDVIFNCPESISHSVKLASSQGEEAGLVAEWESSDAESKAFKDDVNRCLQYWLSQIQTANSFGQVPTVRYLEHTKLKWPWKTGSNEDYFKKFIPEQHTHQFKLGVGYFNQEYAVCGVSLQLSSYPGRTKAVIEASRVSARRGKRARTEDTQEGQVSPEASMESATE